MFQSEHIRNIAIIAHIDHGKTTLLDNLLKQSAVFQSHQKVPDRVMDSYDQEKERGITIFAKHTSIEYKGTKINIIDTPGHADFSGEVERVLGMVNSVLLLVDAREGPMPQTRFVLMKSLQMGLKPIVILNKIDREHADPEKALDLTFDLFAELGANDDQLDFKHCYASGLAGFAMMNIDDPRDNLEPLFKMIVDEVPAPTGDANAPFLMQSASIGYDDYTGRKAIGRILAGSVKKGQQVKRINAKGEETKFRVQKVEGHAGLKQVEIEEMGVGDITAISGLEDVTIGDTLCALENTTELKPIVLEEPTLSIDMMVNSGPFAGQDGKNLTMNKLRERLIREKKSNVTYTIKDDPNDTERITISGRGELHLGVLLEAMRRESYEFCVSKPQVITKEIDGKKCEPLESAHIEVPNEFSGAIIEELGKRKGEMKNMHVDEHDICHLEFLIPTRGLMGYRNQFLTATRGLGILTSVYNSYAPWKGDIAGRQQGVLIAMTPGRTNGYACFYLQERSTLFCKPGDMVYEGMVVGENVRDNDMVVNITKAKQLSNMRASGKDEAIILTPPRVFTLEEAIDFIANDEYLEVTPKHIRMRKRYLDENERKRKGKK